MGNKVRLLVVLFVLLAWQASAAGSLTVESNFTTAQATAADLDRGYLDYPAANRLTVTAEGPWKLYVRTDQDYFSAPGGSMKPNTDLLWRSDSPFQELSTSDELVAEGEAGTIQLDVDYRIKLSWLDPPDYYGITLIYTLTSD